MIKIDRNNLEVIAEQYLKKLKNTGRRKDSNILKNHFLDNFDSIILADPNMFIGIELFFNSIIKKFHCRDDYDNFRKYMDNQYTEMCKHIGKWLSKVLDIQTCPYCNRQYTITINKGKNKSVRPQFDHFLPKSKYPYLALSFYNLIPCCSICNQIKSNNIDKPLLHPYYEGFEDKFKFEVNYLDYILENKRIEKIECKKQGDETEKSFGERCNNNIDIFALNELYSLHSDYAEEIIDKAYAYNQDYFIGLAEEFSKLGKSPSEIKRIIFGNYIDRAENEKRPMSKLTSDILEQIGLKE